jgi:branched-chain amino acid transport system permease protein
MASSSVLGRYYGGSVNRTLMPSVFGLDFSSEAEVYGVTALWTFVVLLAVWFFLRTPLGIMAKAVGENSDRSTFIGYDPRRVKFFTFCFSGFLAGIGGGLFALIYEFVAVETISLSHSWQVLQMVFIGGIGHFAGPVIGAVALTLLFSVLSGYTEVWNLYVGIVFIAMVILAPGGLSDLVSKLFNLVRAQGVRGVGLPALGLAFGLMTVTAGMAAILEPLYALSKKVKRTGTYFDNSEAVFSFTGLLVFGVFLLCLGGYGCRKFLARLSGQS